MSTAALDHDVIVVGAGPTGLLLAGDLARAGLSVGLLEKRDEESNLTRAFAVHARTLEHLNTRGLADPLVETGHPVDGVRLFESASVGLTALPTRFPYVLVTPQYHVERLLLDRAVAAGVVLRRGAAVTGLHQDDESVSVTFGGADGSRSLAARYLVGTDGHHSTVRRQLGLGFPGASIARSLMLADVRMSDPPDELLTVAGNRAGFCFVVPFGDGWYRVVAWDPSNEQPDHAPIDLADVRRTCARVLGTDHGMHSPRWLSRFHSDERQVEHYRRGRVFLAGDAAHVHSPAGGMGMNTGLQDAANLGWKLAAVLEGRVGPGLLDSYEAERKPVGAAVVRTSGGLIRAVMLRHPVARGVRDVAFRVALGFPPAAGAAALRISGLGLRYPSPRRQSGLIGRRAPDLVDRAGRRLHPSLTEGHFTLVAPAFLARRHAGIPGLDTFTPDPGATSMLVRPDGHVAWAGHPGDGLDRALDAWGLRAPDPARPAGAVTRSSAP